MNERDIFRAIGNVDDDLIEGANRTPKRMPLRVYLSTAVAACLCIVVIFLTVKVIPDSAKENGEPHAVISSTEALRNAEGNNNSGEQAEGIALDPPSSATDAAPQGNYSIANLPTDFSFQVSWEGNRYSSEDRILTLRDGSPYSLTLTQQELETVWMLINRVKEAETQQETDLILEYTANSGHYVLSLSEGSIPARQLVELLEEVADRIR